jgi:Heterokaryon incompatibility protein (HET)
MREIYANARQVLIWLGEKEDCDDHPFEYLDRIPTRLHELEDTLEKDSVEHTYSQHMLNNMFDKSEIRNLLAALSQRSWFDGTWVVQEVASAPKAVFMYGSKLISWETVSN